MPFEKLVEELHPDRSQGGLPLVQVLFNFANTPFARADFKHLSWSPYEMSRGAAQLDLGLSIDPLASRKAYLRVQYGSVSMRDLTNDGCDIIGHDRSDCGNAR